jgi:hypothetical protein
MCKVFDDILPVLGSVGGFLIGGPAGAAIGGALGGATGNYVQNHNLLGAAVGGLTGGVGGYFGGGSLANALSGLGSSSVGAATEGFDTGLMANTSANTLGNLESSAGGAGLFGANAGTGTAIGSAANALGGAGLGVAGGDALSGISSAYPGFLGGLGGGTQGTGLGVSGATGSQADLLGALGGGNGAIGESTSLNGTGGTATSNYSTTGGASPYSINSPTSTLSSTQSGTGVLGNSGTTASPIGSNIAEGSQAATTGSGAPYGFDGGASLEGMQAAQAPGGQGAMAAMFGPDSTASASPIGQGISGTGAEVPGASNVQFGALGEGTASAPGAATGATGVNGYDNTGAGSTGSLQDIYNQVSPWARLANVGLNAYQQMAQQQKQNAYANQISNIFSPTGAYAQQMQSNIARQYAQQGRNAEYGPQQVQLAAALAQAQAQALGNQNYYRAATNTSGANALNSLFSNFSSPQAMAGLVNAGQSAYNGLSNLFSGF